MNRVKVFLNKAGKVIVNISDWLFYNVFLAALPMGFSFLVLFCIARKDMNIVDWGGDYSLLLVSIAANSLSYINGIRASNSRFQVWHRRISVLSYGMAMLFYFVIFNKDFANPVIAKLAREHERGVGCLFVITSIMLCSCVLGVGINEIIIAVHEYLDEKTNNLK